MLMNLIMQPATFIKMLRLLPLSCLASAVQSSADRVPIVPISFGNLTGTRLEKDKIDQFMGIPYAEPPVGIRRFAAPEDWDTPFKDGRREALKAGDQCLCASTQDGSEDCLFLNVWTPAERRQDEKLPVLVFIHGGSFTMGNGDQYNMSTLAAKHRSVYVSMNYRLGDLGWLEPIQGYGNFGLLDQRSALRWVQKFIPAFGGDPTRVLVFGESAGAISVALHLVAQQGGWDGSDVGSGGLFHAALMESGEAVAIVPNITADMRNQYITVAGCNGKGSDDEVLHCLRQAPLDALKKSSIAVVPANINPFLVQNWGPTQDGHEMRDDPLTLYSQGNFLRNISLLLGTNTNEGTAFGPMADFLNESAYRQWLTHDILFKPPKPVNHTLLRLVLEQYPANETGDNRPVAAALLGDVSFICQSRHIARAHATVEGARSTFLYRFNAKAHDDTSPALYGVSHGDEVPFVMDHGDWEAYDKQGFPIGRFTADEEKLATSLGEMWASFAALRLPLMRGYSAAEEKWEWQPYSNSTDTVTVLETEAVEGEGVHFKRESHNRAGFCDFWTSLSIA